MTVQLGSVAEWLSGVGTLAALVAASIAARAAIQTSRQQGKQLDSLEQAEFRRQLAAQRRDAAQVAVWVGVDRERQPTVWLVNNSGLPVYELSIWITVPGDTLRIDYQVHGPTSGRVLGRAARQLLAWANDTGPVDGPVDWAQLLGEGQLACAAIFHDASNHWWLRDFDGVLSGKADRSDAMTSALDEVAKRPVEP